MSRKAGKIKEFLQKWVHEFIVVTALLSLLFSTGIGILVGYVKTLPPIEELEHYSPPQATVLYDRSNRIRIASMSRQNRDVVSFREIPDNLKNAFVAIEDKRFYHHFGVDIRSLTRALIINLIRGRAAQGASTITQQLPRNLLKSVTRKKILSRKIRETLLAFQMERRYSKSQILEFYLNQIYLGNGAYGVQAAARTFFNKNVQNLNLPECATIAGIPQRPARFNPLNNPRASKRRRNIVLAQMLKQGYINRTEYDDAVSTDVLVSPPPPVINCAPYFVEYVRKMLIHTDKINKDSLYRDGYVIHTTLDVNMQKIAREELKKGLRAAEDLRREFIRLHKVPEEKKKFSNVPPIKGKERLARIDRVFTDSLNVQMGDYYGTIKKPLRYPTYQPEKYIKPGEWVEIIPTEVFPGNHTFFGKFALTQPMQGAVVILDARTAEIRALCGGEHYYDQTNKGMWDRATQGMGRQPGSAIKPLFFACAMENKYTLASRFNDRKITYADGYSPHNFEDQYFGMTTLEEALEHSRNVVTILLYRALKPDCALPFVSNFDIVERKREWILPKNPTVCLGSMSTTPLSIAAAYVPFVNNGVGIRPRSILQVIGPDKKIFLDFKPFEREIMSPQSAYMINYALQGVIQRGTGKKYIGDKLKNLDVPQLGGKTGTTSRCVDAWFIGFTPENVICVWVGFDDNHPMGPNMTGSRVAGPIWREIVCRIAEYHPGEKKIFDIPSRLVFRDICSKSGKLATEFCRRAKENTVYPAMPFRKGTEPIEKCSYHQ